MSAQGKGDQSKADIPVLLTADSKQLAHVMRLEDINFVIQDAKFLDEGLDAVVHLESEKVLQAATTPALQKMIYGVAPNVLFVAEWGDAKVNTVLNHLVSNHAKLGELVVVLLRQSQAEPEQPFIQRAFAATEKLHISARMLMTTDRPVGSAVRATSYQPWVWKTTHASRNSSQQPTYKMIPMMNPGHDPTVKVFSPDMDCVHSQMAVQYHIQWEDELFTYLKTSKKEHAVMPGKDPAHTRVVYLPLDREQARGLVEELGRKPRFAVMPVPWVRGDALERKPHQLNAFIDKSVKNAHAPYLFSYLLAAIWETDVFDEAAPVVLQAVVHNMVKIGATDEGLARLRKAFPALTKNVGLKVHDPQTDTWLTDMDDGDHSIASSVPTEWGATTAVYAINVPPHYDHKAVGAMFGVTGQRDFVHERSRWSVGEIRTCTWKILGPAVDQAVGHLLKPADGDSPIHIISAHEYSTKKAKGGAKGGKGSGKGGKGGTTPKSEEPPAAEMEVDMEIMKFMRRKRERSDEP